MRLSFTLESLVLILFLSAFSLSACSDSPRQAVALPERTVFLLPGQLLRVQADTGVISLHPVEGLSITVTGHVSDPERTQVTVENTPEGAIVRAEYQKSFFGGASDPGLWLDIGIPDGAQLRVEGFNPTVTADGVAGQITIDLTAGDIEVNQLQGTVVLRSGRGDIHAANVAGDVRILGEHGVLAVEEAHGQLGMSTIMGTIRYSGSPAAGDQVHLEVDHGPVAINLGPDTGVAVKIHTTSGELTCILPGIQANVRACTGTLGSGQGSLEVRTVSGKVMLRQSP